MNKYIYAFTMSLKQSQFEVERLETEAKKMGVEVKRVLYRDLSFVLENGKTKAMIGGEEVTAENTLGMWFRVAGTKSGKYTEARDLLLRLIDKDIFAVNRKSYTSWNRMGKIAQHGVFLQNDIPVVPTRIFYTIDQLMESKFWREFGWPIVVKHERGFQGRSVRKFDNFKQMRKYVKRVDEKILGMLLWQKCLPTKWDLRIIVLGGKAIGAMKRSAVGEEFRSNFSLGGSVEKWDLSDSDRMLAEKVADVCGLDYCGVDIMKDNESNSYILEVNRQCQFKGFEQSTEINVAKKVVELILEKSGK